MSTRERSERAAPGLTPKQERFVAEYLVDLNATQAAIRTGYSKKTAEQQGPRLLGNAGVATAIARGQAKALARLDMDRNRILGLVAEIALGDLSTFYTSSGQLKGLSELGPGQGRLIAGLETLVKNAEAGDGHTDTVLKLKLYDRLKALELLAKYTIQPPAAQVDVNVTVVYEERRRLLELGRARAAEAVIEAEAVA